MKIAEKAIALVVVAILVSPILAGCISDNHDENNSANPIQSGDNQSMNPSSLPSTVGLTCKIISPDNNAILSGLIKISGTAGAENTAIQKVEIKIGGGNWTVATGTASWFYEWNTTWRDNGNYTVRARCDGGKVYSEIELLNITIENKLPNRWAILCCAATFGAFDPLGQYPEQPTRGLYEHYTILLDILTNNLSFPKQHIVSLINESFTKKNLTKALWSIKNGSNDWEGATIVLWIGSHGGTQFSKVWGICPDDNKMHSVVVCYKDDVNPPNENGVTSDDDADFFYDVELKSMLDAVDPPKILVAITACESGCFANQDATGKLNGVGDGLLWQSCGGAGRIIITDTVAPLLAGCYYQVWYFWMALAENLGDGTITGNNDGKTSVEEAFYYYKQQPAPTINASQIECMDDRYPADNPEGEMFL